MFRLPYCGGLRARSSKSAAAQLCFLRHKTFLNFGLISNINFFYGQLFDYV